MDNLLGKILIYTNKMKLSKLYTNAAHLYKMKKGN